MPKSGYWPYQNNYADNNITGESSLLQKQVGEMEGEVKEIQMELAAIKRDRMYLTNRSKICGMDTEETIEDSSIHKNLIQRPQDNLDFAIIPQLREELIRAKNTADEERFQKEKYEQKLKDLEGKLNSICNVETLEIKESRKFPTEDVTSLKKQIRDLTEDIEDLKQSLNEKTEQTQEYRVKYLQAQQQVEELRRQIDVIEYDNKQVSDQIQIEIQKMKMQFQEKLQELAPLPDLLKGAQIQLQEAKQLQKLAEDSSEQLSSELHRVKEKLVVAVNNLNLEKAEKSQLADDCKVLKEETEVKRKEIEELLRSVDDYKCQVLRLGEKLALLDERYKDKSLECTHLLKDLDELRVESNRSLTRSKERSDSMRRYMQTQISEMERQLIQSRAQSRLFQKERDDVRQRMQIQINNLRENFELVEIRMRGLYGQVSSLKNTYSVILTDEDDNCEFTKISTA
ncbi:myosin-10-like [Danaus plexippus]|uniref:Uncharacterized protein n=1 Tax=Danaus plexippus plexippus TaxID=278856 RepID=A0A212FE05_DANPL|nr:myosin-10-like [Danaus plexippus]OWR51917.1 hypothetical protein KGM_207196 [Danaus plexippus plexippus]